MTENSYPYASEIRENTDVHFDGGFKYENDPLVCHEGMKAW